MTAEATKQPQGGDNAANPVREIGSPGWLRSQPDNTQTQPGVKTSEPPVPEASGGLDAGSIGRTSLGLLAVIVLIAVCGWLLKRFGPYKHGAGKSLDVVASQNVGPRERVVVVEIEDTWLVLGVASNSVNTLHTMPAGTRDTPRARTGGRPNPSFSEAFSDNLRRATSRFSRNRQA